MKLAQQQLANNINNNITALQNATKPYQVYIAVKELRALNIDDKAIDGIRSGAIKTSMHVGRLVDTLKNPQSDLQAYQAVAELRRLGVADAELNQVNKYATRTFDAVSKRIDRGFELCAQTGMSSWGNSQRIEKMLDEGVIHSNHRNAKGESLLVVAIKSGNFNTVNKLIAYGARIESVEDYEAIMDALGANKLNLLSQQLPEDSKLSQEFVGEVDRFGALYAIMAAESSNFIDTTKEVAVYTAYKAVRDRAGARAEELDSLNHEAAAMYHRVEQRSQALIELVDDYPEASDNLVNAKIKQGVSAEAEDAAKNRQVKQNASQQSGSLSNKIKNIDHGNNMLDVYCTPSCDFTAQDQQQLLNQLNTVKDSDNPNADYLLSAMVAKLVIMGSSLEQIEGVLGEETTAQVFNQLNEKSEYSQLTRFQRQVIDDAKNTPAEKLTSLHLTTIVKALPELANDFDYHENFLPLAQKLIDSGHFTLADVAQKAGVDQEKLKDDLQQQRYQQIIIKPNAELTVADKRFLLASLQDAPMSKKEVMLDKLLQAGVSLQTMQVYDPNIESVYEVLYGEDKTIFNNALGDKDPILTQQIDSDEQQQVEQESELELLEVAQGKQEQEDELELISNNQPDIDEPLSLRQTLDLLLRLIMIDGKAGLNDVAELTSELQVAKISPMTIYVLNPAVYQVYKQQQVDVNVHNSSTIVVSNEQKDVVEQEKVKVEKPMTVTPRPPANGMGNTLVALKEAKAQTWQNENNNEDGDLYAANAESIFTL